MPNRPPDEAVRIFIEFKTLPSAIKALTDLNGRFFGGRTVKATFYNLDKFKRLELADDA
jgi:splicing factor 45